MDLLNPREATYAQRVENAEKEFLSKEWLDRNLFSAEEVPDDHEITITGKQWFALLMEINLSRKQRALSLGDPIGVGSELLAKALGGDGLELSEVVSIYGAEQNWEGIYINQRKYWAWKGPVVPPWELKDWAKKESA